MVSFFVVAAMSDKTPVGHTGHYNYKEMDKKCLRVMLV